MEKEKIMKEMTPWGCNTDFENLYKTRNLVYQQINYKRKKKERKRKKIRENIN